MRKINLSEASLNELEPDEGTIRTGTKLVSYFDQTKRIDQNQTVFDFLSDGRDFVTIGEREIHIVSYLQLFCSALNKQGHPLERYQVANKTDYC